MKQFLSYLLVAIFAIFVGSQITEGVILVPYWQSLSGPDFYAFYGAFGGMIGRFYTILTIIAALIPLGLAVYFRMTQSKGFNEALISTLLAVLFIAAFYVYFKGANEAFFQSAFSEADLKRELVTWSTWHWGRVVIEIGSLFFLIRSLVKSKNA
ncbi:MAG: hypothetical protein R8G66_22595 [Cytophagales bacterium]|nr:hypothetical protein [Cytophagales bacterium]